jgi:hypothetical protein
VRRHGDLQQTHQVPLNMLILRHQNKQRTSGQHGKPRRKLLTNKDLNWLSGQDMSHYSGPRAAQCRDAWSNFEDTAPTMHMQVADTLHDADRHRNTPDTPTSARSVLGPNCGSAERPCHQFVPVTHSLSQGRDLDKRGSRNDHERDCIIVPCSHRTRNGLLKLQHFVAGHSIAILQLSSTLAVNSPLDSHMPCWYSFISENKIHAATSTFNRPPLHSTSFVESSQWPSPIETEDNQSPQYDLIRDGRGDPVI